MKTYVNFTLVVVLLATIYAIFHSQLLKYRNDRTLLLENKSIPNTALGVRRIFVDLGANCGNSYEIFRNEVEEFYLVEPQIAVFTKWLVPRASSTVHVFNAAVSDHDEENVPFFVDSPFASDLCTFDSGYPHGASSLNSVSATVDGAAPTQQGVQLIDIARFLRETVGARVEDYVILKVDIEGGEEKVLRRLMSENLLYLPDRLLVEWHPSTLAFQREFESSIFSYEQWKL